MRRPEFQAANGSKIIPRPSVRKTIGLPSQWINASKGKTPADKLLDPYQVQDGWFEILLPSLQLRVSNKVPYDLRERAEYVLEHLHLCDDERVLRQRRE